MSSRLQRCIKNSVKHLRKQNTKLFYRGSQRDTQNCLIYAKLMIVFTPNLKFFPYSEIIHESTTFKITKHLQRLKENGNYSIWCFWSSFYLLHCSILDNKCYKQKWGMLVFTQIKLVACVLVCVCAIAYINWKRLDIFKINASFAASEFCEWVQFEIDARPWHNF